ncbi:MAG: NUDIX domain-containing protein [Acidocella sp.]|nr:NUDIX domain-containing protein [Acidocella sp.]
MSRHMASDAQIAKLHAHITACHSATLPGTRLMFYAGPHHIGYVTPALAAQLRALGAPVTQSPVSAVLDMAALPELNALARALGLRIRNEDFDIRATADGPALGVLDRGALPSFGVIGVGVHLNGLVRRADGWHLWVAKRAADKKLDPGKLDHLVAGGVAAGHTPIETLIKEAAEEAALPAALAQTAKLTGRFAYNMERPEGLRRDVVYAYDLELPESFAPQPADGEVESFALWPFAQVLHVLSTSDAFKFNVALVLIDLLIRHNILPEAADSLRTALHGRNQTPPPMSSSPPNPAGRR